MYAFIVAYILSHSWLHCSLKSTTVIALNKIGPSQYTGLRLQSIVTCRGGGTGLAGPVLAGPLFGDQVINIQILTHALFVCAKIFMQRAAS